MVVNLLDADYFQRNDILSFVVDALAPLEEESASGYSRCHLQ
jgi:hypothetical protein